MVTSDSNGSQNGHKEGRRSTKYPGVQIRESRIRRYRGKPDVCYVIDYRDATGARIRQTLGWASEGYTAALANEKRLEIIGEQRAAARGESPLPQVQKPQLTLNAAWEKYRDDWLKAHGKRHESDQWMYDAHLRADLGGLPLEQLTPYRLDQFMATLTAKGLSPQSVKHMVGLARRIMRRMAAWRLYSGPMPFTEISIPKPNNARHRFLTPDEAHSLLDELRHRSTQTWLMALISLHCGLRFGEIAGLRRMDVNFESGLLYIAESKNGQARYAYLTETVMDALHLLPTGPADALLFPSRRGDRMHQVSDCFTRAVNALGLNDTGERRLPGENSPPRIQDRRQRIVFHSLRHTYASWLAQGGAGQAMIAELLGHSSLEMSRRYTHLMSEARRATAETINALFSHTKTSETPDSPS